MNYNDFKEAKSTLKSAEQIYNKANSDFKEIILNITVDEFTKCTYEECKEMIRELRLKLYDNESKLMPFNEVFESKRLRTYPELNQATYYPMINTLDISTEEKIKLDKLAYHNNRCIYYVDDRHKAQRDRIGITLDDISNLYKCGVINKYYEFLCPECETACGHVSEAELSKHIKVWTIWNKSKPLSEEDSKLLDTLDEYGYVEISCYDCDEFYKELSSLDDFERFRKEELIKEYYKYAVSPDVSKKNL